jgi:hypothetical protein
MAYVWLLMMAVWLAALGFGLWWIWPHVERMALTRDLIGGLIWLTIGLLAWLFALNLGIRRYFRR